MDRSPCGLGSRYHVKDGGTRYPPGSRLHVIHRPGTAPRCGVYISGCYNKLTTNSNNLGGGATGYPSPMLTNLSSNKKCITDSTIYVSLIETIKKYI